jgi:hypothetical protein
MHRQSQRVPRPKPWGWLPGQPLADNNDDVLSEPNTLFEGVADLSDDDDVPAPPSTPTTVQSKSRNTPVMNEEELEKVGLPITLGLFYTDYAQLINTPHEDFVSNYVQRYEKMMINSTRARQVRDEADRSAFSSNETKRDSMSASDIAVEQVVALPEPIVTVATPASSRVKETMFSIDLAAGGHEPSFATVSKAPIVPLHKVLDQLRATGWNLGACDW